MAVPSLYENRLTSSISAYFLDRGYPVVFAKGLKRGIQGTDEFGVPVPEGGQWRQADVFACRWNFMGGVDRLETVAVECKRVRSIRDSVNAALGQATDYQLYFDRVYIATEPGELRDKGNVLRSLAIGHIATDGETATLDADLEPQFNVRLSQSLHDEHVRPRATLALAFQEVFDGISEIPLRYGDIRDGGLWMAKPVIQNLQWNCWLDTRDRTVVAAINVEHTADVRMIIARLRTCKDEAIAALQRLPASYRIVVKRDVVPSRKGVPDEIVMPRSEARRADLEGLLSKLESIIATPGWRPHLEVYKPVWSVSDNLNRSQYVSSLRSALDDLLPFMNLLQGCYGQSKPPPGRV